jgi:serine/threonine protein kinase
VLRDEGQLSVARSLKIARQICYSLREAHEKQIIHRDLKPDNIFLLRMPNEPDFVKVLDFGLAKLKEADKTKGTLTQAGMIFGTPKYMSPEQCRSSVIDPRSDIYSLGIILYEMLLGRAPFDGETPLSILLQHIQDMPKDFISVRSDLDIPAPVEELVFKALQKEPDKRFLSISEIEQEIASLEKQYESHYTTVIFCREGLRHKAGLDRSESATVMQTQMAEDLAVLKKARLKKVLVYSTVTVWIVLILTILSIFYFFSFNFLLLSSVRTKGIHFAYFPEYCFRKYRTCCY